MHWLIFKFIFIAKGARFISKRLGKIIIRDGMTKQEKEIL